MTKLTLKTAHLAIGIAALATSTLSAGTFTVNNSADSGNGSLRQAILSANSHGGGNIIFYKVSGVIMLQSPLPAISQSIAIVGPGKNTLTVSGGNRFSIFSVNCGTCSQISGLTIANGNASGQFEPSYVSAQASGVANAGQLEILNCVIQNCTNLLSEGAGIFNSGNLQMTGCLVENCGSDGADAEVDGGAVYNNGTLAMQNSTITNCVATRGAGLFNSGNAQLHDCVIGGCFNDFNEGDGGGIYNLAGTLELKGCNIINCEAGFDGGAIASFGDVTARNTTFTGNNAFEGGGLYLAGGTNLLHGCTISDNEDFGFGGGGLKNLALLTLTRCTVSSNFSSAGAGIENLNVLVMTNCTVSGNTCSTIKGGAILNTAADWDGTQFANTLLRITACTIASNSAAGSAGIGGIDNNGGQAQLRATILAENTTMDFSGSLNSLGYNLILNTNGAGLIGDSTGNIYGQDPLLGPLRNNGGHTFTQALLTGSPAINAGPTNGLPRFDQRGIPRPEGSAEDIGAFELVNQKSHYLSLVSVGNGMQVSLNGLPGWNYTIERANSLAGPWTTLTNMAPGVDGKGTCTDSCFPAGSAFYRLVLPQGE